ncbi:MAG: hypothetical protein JRH11_17335 [Deltaproteobacteria bacterium]|nr:hypothetical protein [Deltaproteobacteria bacterium]
MTTLIFAWAAMHVAVGLHNLSVHLRRPTDLEYLAFAIYSFSAAIYTVGAGLLSDASSIAEGTTAMRVAYIGAPVALTSFVALASILLGDVNGRMMFAGLVHGAAGLFGSLAGVLFDPDTRAAFSPYSEPDQTLWGVAWVIGAVVILSWSLYRVYRRGLVDSDLRILVIGALALAAAVGHDQAVYLLGIPHPYLAEHALVVTSIAFSYMLLRRLAMTERELERRTSELEASYLELQRAQAALIQKEQLAAVGELSAVIAHEIRNPLAILRNAAAGLRRSTLGVADGETLLSIVGEEAERLSRLSQDLAAYAQPLMPSLAALDLQPLIELLAAEVREAPPEDAVIDVNLAFGPTLVLGDPELLAQTLANVFENAVQAMGSGGSLDVRTEGATIGGNPALRIVVSDTGEGMNSLVRDKALDPFFTTRATGTGLGLAIVDRIARAHGGTLRLDSDYGQGTWLTITLPVPPADGSPPLRSPTSRPPSMINP